MGRLLQQARDHPALAVAEAGLAQVGEDVGDRAAGGGLDLRSASRNGSSSALASLRPTLDLPTPISPTSAMVRCRSGAKRSMNGQGLHEPAAARQLPPLRRCSIWSRQVNRPMRSPARLLALLLAARVGRRRARAGGRGGRHCAAPDAFTTPGRDTGLPASLWRGASIGTARTVLPLLGAKPLTPAGQQLARRVLATGAPGPVGAGSDPGLLAGGPAHSRPSAIRKAAAAMLARAPGLDRSPSWPARRPRARCWPATTPSACAIGRRPERRARRDLLAAAARLLPGDRRARPPRPSSPSNWLRPGARRGIRPADGA